jgi:uncharacterized RDD family membrane protein YckC
VIAPRPAGFWIRVVAALVDFAVFGLVKLSFGALAARFWRTDDGAIGVQGTIATCTFLFAALYVIVLHVLEGQTIGKLLVRIRVVGLDGSPPPLGTSLLRFLAYAVSLMPFGMGFVMAGLRADRRGLHDLIAGTRVERLQPPSRRPSQPAPEPEEELLAPP